MDISIYDKLMKEINFEKSFNWDPSWSALNGIEKPIDYAAELSDLSKLKLYYPAVHLNGFFAGFVEVPDEGLHLDGEYTEANYLYIERGEIRYLQQSEKMEDTFFDNFSFFNGNFQLNKSYSGLDEKTLVYVGLAAKFKPQGFQINFNRIEDESTVSIRSRYDRHLSIDVPEDRIYYLNEDIFNNYNKFCEFFWDFKVDVYAGMKPYETDIPFKEGILIIK